MSGQRHVIAFLILLAVFLFVVTKSSKAPEGITSVVDAVPATKTKPRSSHQKYSKGSATNLQLLSKKPYSSNGARKGLPESYYGTIPPVTGKDNAAVQEVIDAVKAKNRPELISSIVPADNFDADLFKDNKIYRDAYLKSSVPARAFKTANPGEGIPVLRRFDQPYYLETDQNKPLTLQVSGKSGCPVTFHCADGGFFDRTHLTAATYICDSSGIATATYTAPPGVISKVSIIAASPSCSMTAKWYVNVLRRAPEVHAEINNSNE
jgi:hypothetical protein